MSSELDSKSPIATLTASIRKTFPSASRNFTLDVRFSAAAGFTILFGASGSGKTTLLDCVAGLVTPDGGRISIGERVLFSTSSAINIPVAKRRVGYVFQDLALFPHLTIEQNTEYGLTHLAPRARRERAASMLQKFPAESASVQPWRVRWLPILAFSCSTSPSPRSMLPPNRELSRTSVAGTNCAPFPSST